jgi:hypothetical protein
MRRKYEAYPDWTGRVLHTRPVQSGYLGDKAGHDPDISGFVRGNFA